MEEVGRREAQRLQKERTVMTQVVISGLKVLEDDITRWGVFCYICSDFVSEFVINPGDLAAELTEHRALHNITE